MTMKEYLVNEIELSKPCFVRISYSGLSPELVNKLKKDKSIILVLETDKANGFHEKRAFVFELMNNKCLTPVIFKSSYSEKKGEDFQVKSAAYLGCLFIDGLGDGIWITNEKNSRLGFINSTAFDILQASRARISKTEYISCPSCGRTNFNIIETLARIKEKTSHLKGLKIGVMGCIVNGVGEMADADYGFIGSGNGKINLYKAKKIIRKNIAESEAVNELLKVIKENGDWSDP
jgi:(E)-4-hydroxy-3-methylbut-2-enyl-diphosphate synthase